jgi:hypothetical protein
MDDLMQNIFYQPRFKKNFALDFLLIFHNPKIYVKGGT